ncbi:MAG: transcription termination/antitermination protein NusA, partial [Blautia sp.]|nr:transcription termination/antitermination protein NusA [Blautia sp.]
MNKELMEAMDTLEKEKSISKATLIDAIQQSLVQACKQHFGKSDNVHVEIDQETGDFSVLADRVVVEQVEDEAEQISLADALAINGALQVGDVVQVPINSEGFGRIATQNAKNVILQKIREEERKALFDQYMSIDKEVVTGIVQRISGKNITINLGRVDAILAENEQVKTEHFQINEHVKVFVLEVKENSKGPRINVSRTHPALVKRLFESEVAEVRDGTVEIRIIAREPGSRTKIAVYSNDPDVDAVGACVGLNGARVNAIVRELRGEKIDIVNWNENPAILIENALSPAEVIAVLADPDEKTALVVVPDFQLSLAIGKEGQNARLAARLTGFKIDIKSETQAREAGDYYDYEDDEEYYEEDEYYPEEGEEEPLLEEGEEYPAEEYEEEDVPEEEEA